MRILALDLSLRRTGWCRDGISEPCPPRTGVWESPGGLSLGKTGRAFQDWLYRAIGLWEIEFVAYEAPILGSRPGKDGKGGIVMNEETVIGLVGLAFVTECMAAARGVPVKRCPVDTIRKYFTGKGRHGSTAKSKQAVFERCGLLGWSPRNTDESDAAACWAWAKSHNEPGFRLQAASPLFPRQRERITT